jgi:IS6 family transposase
VIAAKRFLTKLINTNPSCDVSVITTDKNLMEAYHGKLKRLIKPTGGFQFMKTA